MNPNDQHNFGYPAITKNRNRSADFPNLCHEIAHR